jgi:ABC-2 type transport system ATP-binding protein
MASKKTTDGAAADSESTPSTGTGMTGAISSDKSAYVEPGTTAIEIRNLVKRYRNIITREWVAAVNDISLDVYAGEIFGFLGPNGAGKTTTIKALLGLIFPDSGTLNVLGMPPGDTEVKHKISYLPESPYFYEHMSAREVLSFYASLFGLSGMDRDKRVDYLIDLVGLSTAGNKPLRAFSKGMLQRVGIAQSLVNDPKLLFFDEPTSGLDPIAHRDIRDLILHLKNEGRTLFLSSHQLSDVEMVCDRVSILYRGKLRKVGRVDELIAGGHVEIVAEGITLTTDSTAKLNGLCISHEALGNDLMIVTSGDTAAKNAIVDFVRSNKGNILSITPTRRTLEDIFIETIHEGESEAGEAIHIAAASA